MANMFRPVLGHHQENHVYLGELLLISLMMAEYRPKLVKHSTVN